MSLIVEVVVPDFLQWSEPLSVVLPHCAPRHIARDVTIKQLTSAGVWKELATSDVTLEDIKEFKFVECRFEKCFSDVTLAVVSRIKVRTEMIQSGHDTCISASLQ